ncbi:MAG: hypothetical protein COA87_002385 [Halomonas sp.]|nr:hypothetical protein [Halomonas sp.]MBL1266602.1 hypothetical protein [Halomonas sp.]
MKVEVIVIRLKAHIDNYCVNLGIVIGNVRIGDGSNFRRLPRYASSSFPKDAHVFDDSLCEGFDLFRKSPAEPRRIRSIRPTLKNNLASLRKRRKMQKISFVDVTDQHWLRQSKTAASKITRFLGNEAMKKFKVRTMRIPPSSPDRMQARLTRIKRPTLSADQYFTELPAFEDRSEGQRRSRT